MSWWGGDNFGDSAIFTSDDGIQWTERTSGYPGGIQTVAFGNGLFVGLSHEYVASSADGMIWSRLRAADGSVLPQNAADLVFADQFVSIGREGWIFTSPDGRSWKRANNPTSHWLNAIARGAGQYVAVGNAGAILTSTNAVHWTSANEEPRVSLRSAAFGKDTLVVVGDQGTFLASNNGLAWSAASREAVDLNDVVFGMDTFVAVGSEGSIFTSSSGRQWKRQTSPVTNVLQSVAFGQGQFVAVGGSTFFDQAIVTSRDGRNWTQRSGGVVRPLSGVTFGNGQFVAVGGGLFESGHNYVFSSSDGVNWEATDTRLTQVLSAVACGGGRFVAVGQYPGAAGRIPPAVLTSSNGKDWIERNLGPHARLTDIMYTGRGFLVSSAEGGLWMSSDGTDWAGEAGVPKPIFGLACADQTCFAVGAGGSILQSGAWPTRLAFIRGGLKRTPDGVTLTLESAPGANVLVEASSDLLNWNLLVRTNSSSRLEVMDRAAQSMPRRFYRAQQEP